MAEINGMIRDSKGVLIPNALVALRGEGIEPKTLFTGIDGRFRFDNLPDGTYRINSLYDDAYIERIITLPDDLDPLVPFELKLYRADSRKSKCECISENKYVPLKYAQYFFLGLIGWLFFDALIADQLPDLSPENLNNPETARGIITYLVAVTTISMAAILMLSAMMTGGKDLDRRFALGKEILTLLIGILGTIIGFYYGSSSKSTVGNANTSVKTENAKADSTKAVKANAVARPALPGNDTAPSDD